MVFICGGLGIILHLAWLACLFFIMDEQSVPVHSVPVSDTVHLHLPVPELSDVAAMVQSTDALVQDILMSRSVHSALLNVFRNVPPPILPLHWSGPLRLRVWMLSSRLWIRSFQVRSRLAWSCPALRAHPCRSPRLTRRILSGSHRWTGAMSPLRRGTRRGPILGIYCQVLRGRLHWLMLRLLLWTYLHCALAGYFLIPARPGPCRLRHRSLRRHKWTAFFLHSIRPRFQMHPPFWVSPWRDLLH